MGTYRDDREIDCCSYKARQERLPMGCQQPVRQENSKRYDQPFRAANVFLASISIDDINGHAVRDLLPSQSFG